MGDCRIKTMKAIITRAWGKSKLPLFIIILMAGTWGWTTFAFIFPPMYQESQKVWEEHLQRQLNRDIKDNEESKPNYGEKVKAISYEAEVEKEEGESIPPSPLDIEKIIYETFGEENYKTARAVAFAESRLRADALGKNNNGTTDCGVFQINSIHRLEDCTDPYKNIRYAKQLFDRSGWHPWVAWKTGKYLAYL